MEGLSNSKLLYLNQWRFDETWHSIMHTHPFVELFYVIKGNGLFHIENEILKIKEDDLVIVNAGINHTESSDGKNPLEYIVLGVSNLSIIENKQNYSLLNYYNYKHEVLFYLKTIAQELKNADDDYSKNIIQNLLEVLISNIVRRADAKLSLEANNKNDNHISFIKNYLENNFKENIKLDDLCKACFMNKFYLAHCFKKALGISPMKYLNNLRLKEASLLLENTDYSMDVIARITGLNSSSYFSQRFKKTYGINPYQYRINHQNKKK